MFCECANVGRISDSSLPSDQKAFMISNEILFTTTYIYAISIRVWRKRSQRYSDRWQAPSRQNKKAESRREICKRDRHGRTPVMLARASASG
jgi:hypothetical protein